MLVENLSAWGFAGLTGNQMANWIVEHFGKPETLTYIEKGVEHTISVNPTGYQAVLYATIALYIISLLVCLFLVRPSHKAEA